MHTIELDSAISSIATPIFGVARDGRPVLAGTAVVLLPGLALTARHVLTDFFEQFTGEAIGNDATGKMDLKGSIFGCIRNTDGTWIMLRVHTATFSHVSDLALLQLEASADDSLVWPIPMLQLRPPEVGQHISAMGFPGTDLDVEFGDTPPFDQKLSLQLHPTVSAGTVKYVHDEKRDNSFLNFPCFETDAQFNGGMSGGPVFRDGKLCGVICSSISMAPLDEEAGHIGYAASLWPALMLPVHVPTEDGKAVKTLLFHLLKPGQASDIDAFQLNGTVDTPSISTKVLRSINMKIGAALVFNPEVASVTYNGIKIL
jgi:hypothetical protein